METNTPIRSGYKVITTCSTKNFDFVRGLGVSEAFDYKDPDCGKKINLYTSNNLKYAWDTISTEATAKICAEALSSAPGGRYGALLPVSSPREDLKITNTLLYTSVGEDFDKFGMSFTGNQPRFEFLKTWSSDAALLLADGTVKPIPVNLRAGGLNGALEGLQVLKEGRNSAEKLVYRIA